MRQRSQNGEEEKAGMSTTPMSGNAKDKGTSRDRYSHLRRRTFRSVATVTLGITLIATYTPWSERAGYNGGSGTIVQGMLQEGYADVAVICMSTRRLWSSVGKALHWRKIAHEEGRKRKDSALRGTQEAIV